MPIAKIRLPDGRVAKFSVQEGTTPEQVLSFAQSQFGQEKQSVEPSPPNEINETQPAPQGSAIASQSIPEEPKRIGGLETAGRIASQIGEGVYYHLPAAIASSIEGGDPYSERDWKDTLIERSREQQASRAQEPEAKTAIPGYSTKDIESLGPSIAFSTVGMGAGAAAAIPAAAVGSLATPVAGTIAGYTAAGAASGTAAYRMSVNSFARELRDAADQESIDRTGNPVNDQEFNIKLKQLEPLISEQGLWEAVPEAAGNLIGFGILKSPLKGAIGSVFNKNVLTRAAAKLAALYGTELPTETITQQGQYNVGVEAGLSDKPKREWTSAGDLAESFGEVAPSTIMQTTLMGGVARGGQILYDRYKAQGSTPTVGSQPPSGTTQGTPLPAPQDDSEIDQDALLSGIDEELAAQRGGVVADQTLPEPTRVDFRNMLDDTRTAQEIEAAYTAEQERQTQAPIEAISPELNQSISTPLEMPVVEQEVMQQDALPVAPQQQITHTPPVSVMPVEAAAQSVAPVVAMPAPVQPTPPDAAAPPAPKQSKLAVEMSAKTDQELAAIMTDSKNVRSRTFAEREYRARYPDLADGAMKVAEIERASQDTNAEPTEGQKEAGNYKMGHVRFSGLDISIENPEGSERSGVDKDGEKWAVKMPATYGYIKKTLGKDGDHVDAYVGKDLESDKVYVVDQINNENKAFDEHKTFIGFGSKDQVVDTYNRAFSDGKGPDRLGAITEMSMDDFKTWLKDGNTKKPLAYKKAAPAATQQPTSPLEQALGVPETMTPQALGKLSRKIEGIFSNNPAKGLPRAADLADEDFRSLEGFARRVETALIEKAVPVGKKADAPREGVQQKAPQPTVANLSTVEQTPAGAQSVLQGAERISDKALAERRMEGGAKARVAQKPADDGLFDVAGRGQTDLMDLAMAAKLDKKGPQIAKEETKQEVKVEEKKTGTMVPYSNAEISALRLEGKQVLNLKKQNTGWVMSPRSNNDVATLIHKETNETKTFKRKNGAFAEAQAYAIDYPLEGDVKVTDTTKSRKGKPKSKQRKPLTLAQYLASTGGIRDVEGDLKAMDLDKVFVPGYGKLVRANGRTPDDAMGDAWDAGYFGLPDQTERPTVTDFYNALSTRRNDYSEYDRAEVEQIQGKEQSSRERDQMLSDAEDLGIETEGRTDAQIMDDLRAASETNSEVEDWFDEVDEEERRAIMEYDGGDSAITQLVKMEAIDEEIPFGEIERSASSIAEGNRGQEIKPESESKGDKGSFTGAEGAGAVAEAERKHKKPKKPDTRKVLEAYFKEGAEVISYGGGKDTVLSFDWNNGDWFVRVQGSDGSIREHSTMPTKDKLRDAIKEVEGAENKAPKLEAQTLSYTGQVALKRHKQTMSDLYLGNVTADQLRKEFNEMLAAGDAIKEDLGKRTLKQLAPNGTGGLTKARVIDRIYDSILGEYALKSFTWSPFSEKHEEALARQVKNQTDEDIKEVLERQKKRDAEREQTLTDPQTLSQFSDYIRAKGIKYSEMPAALQVRYDELVAEQNKQQREREGERKAVVRAVEIGDTEMEIIETKHTQKGHDLFVVKLSDRVGSDTFKDLTQKARALGGYYSSYRQQGAVPGFQFKTRDGAEKFVALKEGDVSKKDMMEERQEEREQTAVQRLNALADKLDADAEEVLNLDRLTNTARRATMAENAENDARANKAFAQTMRNIAAAIEAGETKHLNGIRTKTQIETLENVLAQAKHASDQAKDMAKEGNYQELRSKPVTEQDINSVKYPYPFAWNEDALKLAKKMQGQRGNIKMGKALQKWAEESIKAGKTTVVADTLAKQEMLLVAAKEGGEDIAYQAQNIKDRFKDFERLRVLGINDVPSLRAALREYITMRGKKSEADKVKMLERSLIGQKVGVDFFPTPTELAERMVGMAGIENGMRVLEPSAGNGNIAEAMREAGGEVEVAEISKSLRDILEAKEFNVVAQDFMDVTEGGYDAIVMNPPFSNNQDIEHVRKAYELVKEGGKVVAIVGEGAFFRQGKTEQSFRDWLDETGAEVEKLPASTFQDKRLMATTGANARLVVIEKPKGTALFQRVASPTFYSALQRGVEALKQDKAHARQWAGMIRNMQGVKAEEIEWSGVEEWLASQNGPVTRQEVLDYLRANDLQIQEVVKGLGDRRDLLMRRNPDNQFLYDIIDENGNIVKANLSQNAAGEFLENYHDGQGETKFSAYQLEGEKTGYRELLLTLPQQIDKESSDRVASFAKEMREKYGERWPRLMDIVETKKYDDLIDAQKDAELFKSSHFEEPNIVAHIRFNERTDADGKRVLFIEEIQSDWHQAGRKKGYADKAYKGSMFEETFNGNKILDAPFKTTWPELAFKRALRYAAENGFDRVAWTTGEQQAARYDLSKSVESVEWFRNKNGTYDLIINTKGDARAETIDYKNKSTSEIEDIIGKEAAKKIDESAGEEFEGRIAGELSNMDLKVGGEGMKGFYDDILPKAVNKLVKKWGGKTGDTVILTMEGPAQKVHSLDITDNMRESVMQGLPLFQKSYIVSTIETLPMGQRFEQIGAGVLGRPTEMFNQKAQEAFENVRQLIERIAPAANLSFFDGLLDPSKQSVTGAYIKEENANQLSHLIAVSTYSGNITGSALHETYHFLKENGFFKENEISALQKAAEDGNWVKDHKIEEKYALADGSLPDRALLIEEAIAEQFNKEKTDAAKETMGDQTLINRLRQRMMRFWRGLRNIAKRMFGDNVTADDVFERILSGEVGKRKIDVSVKKGSFVFNQFDDDAKGKTPYTSETININGKERTTKNSDGMPIARTEEGLRNFWTWFGDSKVIDAQGRPLVVYHGSPDVRELRGDEAAFKSRYERWGMGEKTGAHWFTNSKSVARSYTDERRAMDYQMAEGGIVEAYIKLENPLIVEGKGNEWRDVQKRGKTSDVIKEAQKNGKDGVFIRNVKDNYTNDKRSISANTYTVFDGKQIKSVSNRGTFDLNDPRIYFQKPELERDILGETPKQAERNRMRAEIVDKAAQRKAQGKLDVSGGRKGAWDVYNETGFDSLVARMQNNFIDLRRAQEAIKEFGGVIPEMLDVYKKIELFYGRAASRVKEFVFEELGGLTNYMSENGIEIDELGTYLHARHAKEANEHIAEINPEMPDGGSGMTNQEADDILNGLSKEKKAALEGAEAFVRAMIDETKQVYLKYNLVSAKEIDAWDKMFKNYIPLMRDDGGFLGTGQGFTIRGKEVKSRTGSKREVVNILANIAMQRERAIVRGEKNRVDQALAGLVKMFPNKDFWYFEDIPHVAVKNEKTGLVEMKSDQSYRASPYVMTFKLKGKNGRIEERAIVFNKNNERAVRLAKNLKNMDTGSMAGLWNAMSTLTRFYSSINTQYNVAFGPFNLARDVQSAAINMMGEENGKFALAAINPKQIAKNIGAVYRYERAEHAGKSVPLSEEVKYWIEMVEEGGMTGYRDLFRTSEDRAKAIQKQLARTNWKNAPISKVFSNDGTMLMPYERAKRSAGWIGEWVSDYNTSLEAASRLAVYMACRKAGLSKQKSASIAKNVTVNFNRRGEWGQQAGALYAFFNASVQGTARIADNLFDMQRGDLRTVRLSKAGKKIVAGGLLLGVMNDLLLAAFERDERDPPEWKREKNLVIPVGGDVYISSPLALGYNMIFNIGRMASKMLRGGYESGFDYVKQFASMAADSLSPIGSGSTLMQSVMPTAFAPIAALSENKDWTGRPIAKQDFNSLAPTPGHTRAKYGASAIGQIISEAVNWMTGGDKYSRGELSPTPDQIDYLIGQITGGAGRTVMNTLETVKAPFTDEGIPIYKVPVVGRIVGTMGTPAAVSERFYENVKKINELDYELDMRSEADDGVDEFVAENERVTLEDTATTIQSDIKETRKQIKYLIANGGTKEEIKELNDSITELMKELNKMMEEMEN